MKIKDCELLIVPGLGNASPFHWQSRWQDKMSTARRVEQDDWDLPRREHWANRLIDEVEKAEKPVILIAHSVGVLTVAHAAPALVNKVAGAFLVGASDWERPELKDKYGDHGFDPVPRVPLGFPGLMLASSNDPSCNILKAEAWARDWEVRFGNAGEAGHFEAESGHGPWPEGLMAFAKFTQSLGTTPQ
ncbi:alpha/beta hydrolase [Maricaulis sp. W15]|uniref:RBBP9/YdeN family alpha/beta hydrolase n=1 Tax=Maricaulis sp. W15 TaxID=1772333 RepID=UPI0009489F02|nr:alpha/beta hydrolase [Maricaulis sp. W15]OLF81304.1 alpha/beta hydrolase [Maricaulis sp. W15]